MNDIVIKFDRGKSENKNSLRKIARDNVVPFPTMNNVLTFPKRSSNTETTAVEETADTTIDKIMLSTATEPMCRADGEKIMKLIILHSHSHGLKVVQLDAKLVSLAQSEPKFYTISFSIQGPTAKVLALEGLVKNHSGSSNCSSNSSSISATGSENDKTENKTNDKETQS